MIFFCKFFVAFCIGKENRKREKRISFFAIFGGDSFVVAELNLDKRGENLPLTSFLFHTFDKNDVFLST